MKILFVAMPFSIHTARWISQLEATGWDVHLFSSMPYAILHEQINGVTYHENFYQFPGKKSAKNRYLSVHLKWCYYFQQALLNKVIRKITTFTGINKPRAVQLAQVIQEVKPDIIHSFETQHAGYLVTQAKQYTDMKFPLWIHSNWGIDLHFFGRLESHLPLIKNMLREADMLVVEGERDEILARTLGFNGVIATFPSVGGGFKVPPIPILPPSVRKKILVKGTQDLVRRGLVALRALERCADLLTKYEIVLYSTNEETKTAAELFHYNTGKRILVLNHVDQDTMLQLNSEARVSICVNLSDGLPNAMLEAMLMGAFPIQSHTSVADEWIRHAITGMLVPPEDPDIIEMALRKALMDDEMVDNAAIVNREIILKRLDYEQVKQKVIHMYESVMVNSIIS